MKTFKLTYRKIVTHTRVDGVWEVDVQADSIEQAQRVLHTGLEPNTKLGVARKVCETLGTDSVKTTIDIRKVE